VFDALANYVRSGPVGGALKAVVPAIFLAFGVASAPAVALADTYVMQDADMYNYRYLTLSGSGYSTTTVKAAPVLFDGYIKGTPNEPYENLVAFCVDVYHSVQLQEYNPDLTYTDDVKLTHNSHWDPNKRELLTFEEKVQIGRLVNYGTEIWYDMNMGTTRYNELAAVQGAIWKVVSGLNVTANSAYNNGQNSAINNRISALSNASYESAFLYADGDGSARIKLLTPFTSGWYAKQYPHKALPQSFAIAGPIPEPGTWVMMIGGFAFAGGAAWRRRQQFVLVKVRHG
jgi:hypothetical protein